MGQRVRNGRGRMTGENGFPECLRPYPMEKWNGL